MAIAKRPCDEANLEPNERYRRFEFALAYYARGDRATADATLAQLVARDRDVMAYQVAEVYATSSPCEH